MFCQKCGTKAIEGASFCQKCGAKLVKEKEVLSGPEPMTEPVPKPAETPMPPVEPVSPPIETPPQPAQTLVQGSHTQANPNQNPKSTADIYKILLENTAKCPVIKSAKQLKKGVSFRSGILNYSVIINKDRVRIGSFPAFPFSLLYGLAVGLVFSVAFNIGWDQAEYGYIYFEDYAIQIIFSLLLAGLGGIVHVLAGRKSRAYVAAYIHEIVEPHGIEPTPLKKMSHISTGGLILSITLVVTGIILLTIPLFERLDFNNAEDTTPNKLSEPYTDGGESEEILLTQVYTNEDERISFMYPDNWDIVGGVEESIVAVTDTGTLYFHASVAVDKFEAENADNMTISREAYEEEFNSRYDDFTLLEFSDATLSGIAARKIAASYRGENGMCIELQYMYINGGFLYIVKFGSLEENYERHKPIFDAIIDSYTIISVDTPVETADSSPLYGDALMQLIMYNILPDGESANDSSGQVDGMYDRFAICDIDGDEEKELLIEISSGSMAASALYIYEPNAARAGLQHVWSFAPGVTFYDTGCVKEEWSHNQGLARNFWPYSIYQRTDAGYSQVGSADAWEKTYMDTDFSGNPFPEDVDSNGNGIVYFISDESGYIDDEHPVDDAEYKKFEEGFLGGADDIYIPWQNLYAEQVEAATGVRE